MISDQQGELEQTKASNAGLIARAEAQAIGIRTVAEATAESIRKVNNAIKEGGEASFRYRQIEMLPEIAPVIADALGKVRLINFSSDGTSAAGSATNNITQVIQSVMESLGARHSALEEGLRCGH